MMMIEKLPSLLPRDYADRLADVAPPCVSLFQPTHRSHPDNTQDPIRFRNQLKTLELSLREMCPAGAAAQILEPFEALAQDEKFWAHTLDGLAVFGAEGMFEVFRTQRPVPALAIVADTFHTKPLRRLLQTADSYQVLALNRASVRLMEGNRDALDEIDLSPGVPSTITDALGDELTDPHMTIAATGGAGPGAVPMRHVSGGKSDEVDKDTERYFRAVDRAVHEHHSRPSGLPLILVALPEYHALFRKVSSNPLLAETGIMINPEALSNKELCERAWAVNDPVYRARLASLRDAFAAAQAHGSGSQDLAEIAQAGLAGRVDTLLVEANRQVPGVLDAATGRIRLAELDDPKVDDLLDDVAELVESQGGTVLVVPAAEMPVTTGVAALFRF